MSTKCYVKPIFPNINTYAIFVSASKHMSGSQYLVKINLTWSFHTNLSYMYVQELFLFNCNRNIIIRVYIHNVLTVHNQTFKV